MDASEIARRQSILLVGLGVPYAWGAGTLKDADPTLRGVATQKSGGRRCYDCSGWAQHASVALGDVRKDAWTDLRAVDIANACDALTEDQVVPGDFAFFGSPIIHIGVVFAARDGDRPVMMIEAGGGGRETHGADPDAVVEIRSAKRSSLLCFGRLKRQHRQAGSRLP